MVAWIGAGFVGSDLLALAFTGLIGAVYCLGFGELVNFRRQTRELNVQVHQLPESQEQVNHWLGTLPAPPMQFPVQRRIEGHAAALPGPQLTPYLTGLLVMLGLLGTFAGMIVTLGGAASALDNSTELSAIRSALAAPIAGLSLAFGTSIAGVAASAMLGGLASTLSRRDRLQASRALDSALRDKLHHLSTDHQRHQAFQALESQAKALPEMASAMERMTARMEQLGQQLEQSLTHNQQEFHSTVGRHYQTLADSVANSLTTALDNTAKQASERIEPIVVQALEQLQKNAHGLQQSWADNAREQLTELISGFQTVTTEAGERWQHNLSAQQAQNQETLAALSKQNKQSQSQLQEQLHTWLGTINDQHQTWLKEQQQQLVQSCERLNNAGAEVSQHWQAGLARQQAQSDDMLAAFNEALTQYQSHFQTSSTGLIEQQQAGLAELVSTVAAQLDQLREQESERARAANERMEQLEATAARHLSELGTALEAPMTRLIETASETPKAAAEVIRQLQSEIARNSERENELLEERQRLVQELDTLLENQRSTADSQREAVDTLITGAGETLTGISERFNTLIQEQSQQLGKLGDDITGSSRKSAP